MQSWREYQIKFEQELWLSTIALF